MRPPGPLEWAALLGLAVMSMVLLTPIVRAARAQRARRSWPSVTGFVVAHNLRPLRHGWVPEYQVRYQWQGTEYLEWCTADDGKPVTGSGTTLPGTVKQAAQRELDRHPIGREIRVLVDPAAPRRARVPTWELPLTAVAAGVAAILLAFIAATVRWAIL